MPITSGNRVFLAYCDFLGYCALQILLLTYLLMSFLLINIYGKNTCKPLIGTRTSIRGARYSNINRSLVKAWDVIQEAQLSLTNRSLPVCKVVEVLQDFLSEYVDKKFTRDYNVILYLSIFNSFRVIRCLSQCVSPKISIFTTFLFPLGTPLWQSRKTLHKWKDNSVLAEPLAACTHLSSTVSQLFEPQVQKILQFSRTTAHTFVSPGAAPATITQYVP